MSRPTADDIRARLRALVEYLAEIDRQRAIRIALIQQYERLLAASR